MTLPTMLSSAIVGAAAGYVVARVLAEWLDLDALAEDVGVWLTSQVPVGYERVRREVSV